MSENQVITNMENEVEEMTAIHYLIGRDTSELKSSQIWKMKSRK